MPRHSFASQLTRREFLAATGMVGGLLAESSLGRRAWAQQPKPITGLAAGGTSRPWAAQKNLRERVHRDLDELGGGIALRHQVVEDAE